MSSSRVAPPGLRAADVEQWLAELGLEPVERADRDGIAVWDVILDGRRRRDLRVTLICQPDLGLICWAHYAPPLNDMFRKSYRRLLRWNDELPFVKFSIGEDERPILTAELGGADLSADGLGLALVRMLGVCDQLLEESAAWLWLGGRPPAGYGERPPRNAELIDRYAARLPELFGP